ncbi:MAG: TIGR00270 family protein [Candidatus Aenigmarchaeota archaeon]|nr:TIGR00270 family protein [Candidatus Aenigmarchaeota archaeon]
MDDAKECDLCGRQVNRIVKCRVEGSVLSVCTNCSEYGSVIKAPKPVFSRSVSDSVLPESIVPDAASRIRRAREKQNLSIELLAQKMKEKESVLHRIEQGKFIPPINLARKIERVLRIVLIDKGGADLAELDSPKATGALTLGDLLKEKLEKKN